MKQNLLFVGWFDIPHSYAIVNCNQLISLIKKYSSVYNFYRLDYPYPDIYKNKWNNLEQKKIYSEESYKLLSDLKPYKGEKIDLIYSITYPYDVNLMIHPSIPKVVFFTSEFTELNASYFNLNIKVLDDALLGDYLESHKNVQFTSPSVWSKDSLKKYGRENTLIPHGVDQDVFKIDKSNRQSIRDLYKFKDDDIVFLNLGSMTGNKGIIELFIAITVCICRLNMKHLKLVLKGINDLYQSEDFVVNYMKETIKQNVLKREEVDYVLENNVIFFNKTLSFKNLSDIYNACDVYISPYKAEGFNLTVLEALACGMDVIVSDNGSTKFFVDEIVEKTNDNGLHLLKTVLTEVNSESMKELKYDINDIINIIHNNYKTFKILDKKERVDYIHKNFSWDNTADKLHELFSRLIV